MTPHPQRPWTRIALMLLCAFAIVSSARPASADDTSLALLRPVDGAVIRGFDPPAEPWLAGHRGVDLQALPGTTVVAAADGVVTVAGPVAGIDVVAVQHRFVAGQSLRTTYEPVSPLVSVGEHVRQGEPIGVLLAGHCLAGCLHWGLKLGSSYLDPLGWLIGGTIRLLPDDAKPSKLALPAVDPSASGRGDGGVGSDYASKAVQTGRGRRPVPGPVTSPFGMRLHPILQQWRLHDGIDLGAACQTPVAAAWSGTVIRIEHDVAWGNRVIIDHGMVDGHHVVTASNHLAANSLGIVRLGQHVNAGQVIGLVGSTGWSTGCHLHFTLWSDGKVTDPSKWL